MKKDLRESLEGCNLYNYIASNYYKLTKEELASIIKELDFIIYEAFGAANLRDVEQKVAKNLLEQEALWEE